MTPDGKGVTYKHTTIYPNRGERVIDVVYALVVQAARRVSFVDLLIRKVHSVGKHQVRNAGCHA